MIIKERRQAKMTPITQLIKEFKTQKATADALGVPVTYIRRWIKAGAFINRSTGEVFVKSKTKVKIKELT